MFSFFLFFFLCFFSFFFFGGGRATFLMSYLKLPSHYSQDATVLIKTCIIFKERYSRDGVYPQISLLLCHCSEQGLRALESEKKKSVVQLHRFRTLHLQQTPFLVRISRQYQKKPKLILFQLIKFFTWSTVKGMCISPFMMSCIFL